MNRRSILSLFAAVPAAALAQNQSKRGTNAVDAADTQANIAELRHEIEQLKTRLDELTQICINEEMLILDINGKLTKSMLSEHDTH